MQRSLRSHLARCLALGLLGLAAPLALVGAQEKTAVPPGAAVNITVVPGGAPAPPVSITLHERQVVMAVAGRQEHHRPLPELAPSDLPKAESPVEENPHVAASLRVVQRVGRQPYGYTHWSYTFVETAADKASA